VGVEDGLPVAHLLNALLAAQVLLYVCRVRRVVQLIPVRLDRAVLRLLFLLAPTASLTPLPLVVEKLVFVRGSPVS